MAPTIASRIGFVDLEVHPGWETNPVCLSTIVILWVNSPSTGFGSFWGSNEITWPGAVVGGDVDGRRIAAVRFPRPARQWGHGPMILRISLTEVGVAMLYECLPIEISWHSLSSGG